MYALFEELEVPILRHLNEKGAIIGLSKVVGVRTFENAPSHRTVTLCLYQSMPTLRL